MLETDVCTINAKLVERNGKLFLFLLVLSYYSLSKRVGHITGWLSCPSNHHTHRVASMHRLIVKILLFITVTYSTLCSGQVVPIETPLEVVRYARISASNEISRYIHALAERYPELVRVESIGRSVLDRPIEVMRFSAPRRDDSAQRLTAMIVGSQHGAAEPAGGEAMLMIARELADGYLRPLLEEMDVILLPNANPDGRDLGRRSNANRVNINTDFVLLTQPETRILKDAVARYAPDVLLDSHESAVLKRETLATEGYLTDFDAQFEISNNPAVPAVLRDYALNTFLPALTGRVTDGGLPAHRYIGEITRIKQPITNGGLTLRNFRNAAAMSGALSLLVETKLDSREQVFPTYRNIAQRVARQLLCFRSFLTLAHEQRAEIQAKTAMARAALHRESLTLYAGYALNQAQPLTSIPMRRLDNGQLQQLDFPDHRHQINADEIAFPPMLVITRHQDIIRPLLDRHRIDYQPVLQSSEYEVVAMRLDAPANSTLRAGLLAETQKTLTIDRGSLLINLFQPNGRAAALLLDPRSISSIFRYPEYASLVEPETEFFIYRIAEKILLGQP